MRARFLANASMSTAPTFTGAGATLSFMVTPPPAGRVNLRSARFQRSLLWTYWRATAFPDQYIEFTPISRFDGPIFAGGFAGTRGWDGWQRRGSALRREDASGRGAAFVAAPVVAAIAGRGRALPAAASISEKFAETASQMPGIGLPAGAPERPAEPTAYPAVHDIPPPRNSVVLTNIEQRKLERRSGGSPRRAADCRCRHRRPQRPEGPERPEAQDRAPAARLRMPGLQQRGLDLLATRAQSMLQGSASRPAQPD